MRIKNQDRDRTFTLHDGDSVFPAPVIKNGILFGFNLYLNKNLLGTFDTMEEALYEISNIRNYTGKCYYINGYSAWEATEVVKNEVAD